MNKQILEWLSKNSEKVIEDLDNAVKQTETISRGLEKVRDSVLKNESDANTRKQLYITMKSLTTMANIVRKLVLINMVLVSGKEFKKEYKNSFEDKSIFDNLFGSFKL